MEHTHWGKFEMFLEKKLEEEHIPGLSIGISQMGKPIFQKGFGYRDFKAKLPVTAETIFGIASITKSFTAVAILELEGRKLLSVHDSVVKHLPELKMNGVKEIEQIKIHHLLSHTTGIPPMERKEEFIRFEEHMAYFADTVIEPLGKPGEYFSYCNDTFLLLGTIIERVTGQSFETYITERFLHPLEMNRSTFHLEELAEMENVSVPYEYHNKMNTFEETAWPKLGNYKTGGGIRSNVQDLLKYGQYLLCDKTVLNRLADPVYKVGRNTYYGYALSVIPNHFENCTLISHGGGQPGVSSFFGVVPEKNLIAVVLTNVGGIPAGEIWLAAVNAALGIPYNYKRETEPFYDISTETSKGLMGTYQSLEGDRVRFFVEKDTMFMEENEEKKELRASAKDRLVIQNTDRAFQFYLNDDQKTWAVFNGSRMLRKVGE